ncbi:hypothetical protein HOLleu_01798 [Holothuria leucospilota]|uniref:Uncharacterized protein n=1 Tax=Holothuria leucospilota TaxID=206669 RepID=A0A9Q1CQX1_HOLLE|nr:hypothetical protein HOLleu_01798 [Holothuria leucospilota]
MEITKLTVLIACGIVGVCHAQGGTPAPTTPTPEIPVEPTTLTSSSGNFTGQGPESTQNLTSSCSDCLVWKIFAPILVIVVMILV